MELPRAAAFFDYLKEREEVRLRKEAGLSVGFDELKWTDDPILSAYKFTNVRRHHDRTSRELRERFYNPHFFDDRRSVLMNCALFRYFGTWEFAAAVGWQDYDDFDFEGIKELAEERLENRERVFTGAYVITNQGISAPKQEVVVDYFLKGLHAATPAILAVATKTQSWEKVATEMRKLNGFGGTGFMAKEVLIDTTYTAFWADVTDDPKDGRFSFPRDWWQWTPIGPGALRGCGRVLSEDYDVSVRMSESKARSIISDLAFWQEGYWPVTEYGQLSPTDIQFGLCEFDKYERVRLGQGAPRSRYKAR